jgi:hypothetical protein
MHPPTLQTSGSFQDRFCNGITEWSNDERPAGLVRSRDHGLGRQLWGFACSSLVTPPIAVFPGPGDLVTPDYSSWRPA